MKRTTLLFLYILVLLAGFSSCDSNHVFNQYQEIPESSWNKDLLVIFHIPVTDTLQNHNLLIQLRNKITYKYSNLWLFIEIIQPGGEVLRDTLEIVLAEPSGRWLGKGFGGLKTLQYIYRRNVYFPVSGEYSISLQHGMREEFLNGIHDMGIRVEKVTGREQKQAGKI